MEELYINIGKIFLSILLSLFIGLERDQQNKPAGARDVCFVTLASTLFTIIGLSLVDYNNMDGARLLYASIIGVGFIGGGVIMQNKRKLKGLTTASLLFIMVALGLLIGIGEWTLSLIVSISIYIILKLKHVTIKIRKGKKRCKR